MALDSLSDDDLLVEHALIIAGAWWPSLRQEIMSEAEGLHRDAEARKRALPSVVGVVIARQRSEHPERFLPAKMKAEIDAIEDPAERYLRSVEAIGEFRHKAVDALLGIRESENGSIPSVRYAR